MPSGIGWGARASIRLERPEKVGFSCHRACIASWPGAGMKRKEHRAGIFFRWAARGLGYLVEALGRGAGKV